GRLAPAHHAAAGCGSARKAVARARPVPGELTGYRALSVRSAVPDLELGDLAGGPPGVGGEVQRHVPGAGGWEGDRDRVTGRGVERVPGRPGDRGEGRAVGTALDGQGLGPGAPRGG